MCYYTHKGSSRGGKWKRVGSMVSFMLVWLRRRGLESTSPNTLPRTVKSVHRKPTAANLPSCPYCHNASKTNAKPSNEANLGLSNLPGKPDGGDHSVLKFPSRRSSSYGLEIPQSFRACLENEKSWSALSDEELASMAAWEPDNQM